MNTDESGINNKRRKFLINRQFQLNFMGYTVGMAAVIIAVFYFSNLYFFWKFMNKGKEIGLAPDHLFFQFLAEQQHTMDFIFIGTAIFAFLFLIMYGFYLSHRVAGALHHLETHLKKYGDSDKYVDLKFRKTDYFQEIPDALNEFVKKRLK